MSSSDSYELRTLIFQSQLQIQRMSSCPACAVWHCYCGAKTLHSSAPVKPVLAQLQERGWPGTAQDAPRQICFLPFLLSPWLLECVCTWWKKCKSREKQPGTSLSCHPPFRHSGSRQHQHQGKPQEPLMPVSGETPGGGMNFGVIQFGIKGGKCIICTNLVNAGSQRKRQNLFWSESWLARSTKHFTNFQTRLLLFFSLTGTFYPVLCNSNKTNQFNKYNKWFY